MGLWGIAFFPEVSSPGLWLAKKTGYVRDFGLKEQIHPGTIWRKITLKQ